MSSSEDNTTNMSVHSVTPSTEPVVGVKNAGYVMNEDIMTPADLKEQESHVEEHIKSNIVAFCAFIVAKPKLSFGE